MRARTAMISLLASFYLFAGISVALNCRRPTDPVGLIATYLFLWPLVLYLAMNNVMKTVAARKELVTVSLELLESGRRVFRVKVRWAKDPRRASHIDVDPTDIGTTKMVQQKVLLCAGALAEKHCGEYGDTLDPDLAVRLCAESFKKCLMDEAQRTKMVH